MFRIALIPVFAVVMFSDMIAGLIVFLICASTDLVDGYVARRFKMVSDVGKFLDPVADKLMHITVMICLSFVYKDELLPFYILTVIIGAKEAVMLLAGLFLVTKKVITAANVYGKAAMFILSLGVVVIFFGQLSPTAYIIGFIISSVGVCVALIALCVYAARIWEQLGNKLPDGKAAIEIDTTKKTVKEQDDGKNAQS
jgi:CDP-diacylglycerol--glycerol-3-phosphate 3-phosphatidyltransferase